MTDSNTEHGSAIVHPVREAASLAASPDRLRAAVRSSIQALAEATTHTERLMHRRNWRAILAAAKELGLTEVMVEASVMTCTAERAIFRADEEIPPAKRGRGNKAVRDIDGQLLRQIRRAHRRVDTRLFNRLVEAARTHGEPITRKTIRLAGLDARGGPVHEPKVAHYSGESDYITPRYIIEVARRTMGAIDLDPASFPKANEFVRAERYFMERDNGLRRRWSGRVWLNPPYTRQILTLFVDRLIEHLEVGHVTQACLLVNNSTDAEWFHIALDHALAFCLLSQRVRFHRSDGSITGGSPIQGQVMMYFASEPGALERFTAECATYGRVCRPVLPELA